MLEATNRFSYAVGGQFRPPTEGKVMVGRHPVTAQRFNRPSRVLGSDIGRATSDEELGVRFNTYRVWRDYGGDSPGDEYSLRQGQLTFNGQEGRAEQVDLWELKTEGEVEAKRAEVMQVLRDDAKRRNVEVNEHIAYGSDGIDASFAEMQASRRVSQKTTLAALNRFGDWLRANTQVDPPQFTVDGAGGSIRVGITDLQFRELVREEVALGQIVDIREAFKTVRQEIRDLTTYSELAAYDVAGRMDEILPAPTPVSKHRRR